MKSVFRLFDGRLEKLILKLAKDNSWGYTRILGELRKLGIKSVTRNTVKNILKRNGYDTGPARGTGTWDEFLKRHAKTIWQCDFFSKKIVCKTGLRDIFVLVFLNVKTRQVYITPSTYKPAQAWMIEQADAFIKHTQEQKLPCKIVMHDNDGKYSKPFLDVFKRPRSSVRANLRCRTRWTIWLKRQLHSCMKAKAARNARVDHFGNVLTCH